MSKNCTNCGAVMQDDQLYCQQCGAQQTYNNYAQPVNNQNYNNVPTAQDTFHTGIGGWIGWILLTTILPLIGLIIALCCSNDKSVKNWAAAMLILGAIAFIGGVMIAAIFAIVFNSAVYYNF